MLEKLDMGKHALYVWSSFGVTALCMILEPLLLRSRARLIKKRILRIARLEQEVQQ